MRICLLLVNPKARSGAQAKALAKESLRGAGFRVEAPEISEPQAAHAAIRDTDAELVVLGGGDGTVAAAAPALLDAGKTVGILPLGTANDLASSLGIPKRLADAARIVAEGEARPVDVGMVNGQPFFNAVTIGLGVDVIRAHEGPMKKRLGIFNYPRVILQTMARRRYFRAELDADGEQVSAKLLHIGVANGRYHGGGLPAHEDATIDDGILHLYAVRRATPLRYLATLPQLASGRSGNRDLLRLAGAVIRIETEEPMPATADGEEIGTTPLELRCAPEALRIMTPRSGIARKPASRAAGPAGD